MKYYERNKEAIAAEQNRLNKEAASWGVDVPLLYARPGSTMVRILPAYKENGEFFKRIYVHRVPTVTQAWLGACPLATADEPCAVCEKGQELMESRDETKMKFARENLKPRPRFLYNVICLAAPPDRDGNRPDDTKIYVLETGIMVHKQIISLDQDEATGWADISNPNNAAAIVIKRTGQHMNDTRYDVTPTGAGRTSIFAELQQKGVDPNSLNLYNLDDVYKLPDADTLKEVVNQMSIGGYSVTGPTPSFGPATPASQPVPQPVPVPTPQPAAPTAAAPQPVPVSSTSVAPPVIPDPPSND